MIFRAICCVLQQNYASIQHLTIAIAWQLCLATNRLQKAVVFEIYKYHIQSLYFYTLDDIANAPFFGNTRKFIDIFVIFVCRHFSPCHTVNTKKAFILRRRPKVSYP